MALGFAGRPGPGLLDFLRETYWGAQFSGISKPKALHISTCGPHERRYELQYHEQGTEDTDEKKGLANPDASSVTNRHYCRTYCTS